MGCVHRPERGVDQVDGGFETEDIHGTRDTNMGRQSTDKAIQSAPSSCHAAFLTMCKQGVSKAGVNRCRLKKLARIAARRWCDQITRAHLTAAQHIIAHLAVASIPGAHYSFRRHSGAPRSLPASQLPTYNLHTSHLRTLQ